MRKRLLPLVLVLVAVTVGAAAFYKARASETGPGLLTAAVARGDIVESVNATGTLEAVTTVQVGTQVSGTIKSLFADFNTRVRKGQVVAELEPSLFQAQVDQARASVVRLQAEVDRAKVQAQDAQVKLKRAEELSNQQLIARSELETAQTTANEADAAVKSAEAQVTQAQASLNQNAVTLQHSVITAPIDGIVISRNVDVGQTVAASMSAPTLFVIAQDLTQMRVNASVDEADIGRIKTGQPVTFRVDAYPNDTFKGIVSQVRLQPVTESNVVSYVTVIDVSNPDLKLKPGMTANVTVEIARADDVLKVPTAALRYRPTAETFAALKQGLPRAGGRGAGERAEGSGARGFRLRPGGRPQGARGARPPNETGVWVLADTRLSPVRGKTGISDGTSGEVEAGGLSEGAQVVTGAAAPAAASAAG